MMPNDATVAEVDLEVPAARVLPAPGEAFEPPAEFKDLYLGQEEREEFWVGAYPDGPCQHYALGWATFYVNSPSGVGGIGQVVKLTKTNRLATLECVKKLVVRLQPLPAEEDQDGNPLPLRYRQLIMDRTAVKMASIIDPVTGVATEALRPTYTRGPLDYPLACHLFCVDAGQRHDFKGGKPPRLLPFPAHIAPVVEAHYVTRERQLSAAVRARGRGPVGGSTRRL